jgi:hypothetical protein
MAAGGLVIRTQDGATYFIRDEVLEACKVADDELEVTEAMIEESDDVAGFSLNFATPVQFGSPDAIASRLNVQPNVKSTIPDLGKSMSTIMCCW